MQDKNLKKKKKNKFIVRGTKKEVIPDEITEDMIKELKTNI